MTRKVFAFEKKDTKDVSFDLGGVVIHCRPQVSGLVLMEFTSVAMTSLAKSEDAKVRMQTTHPDDDAGPDELDRDMAQSAGNATRALYDLLQESIIKSDWQLFKDTVADQGLGIEDVSEIGMWLVQEYTANPTVSR